MTAVERLARRIGIAADVDRLGGLQRAQPAQCHHGAVEIVGAEIAEIALAVGPAVDRLAEATAAAADLGMALLDAGLDGALLGLAEGAQVELASGPQPQRRQLLEEGAVALGHRAFTQRPHADLEEIERIGAVGRRPIGHRLGRRHGALAHQFARLEDAPFVAHVGSLQQHAGLQDADAVEFLGPIDQDAPQKPHRVGGRPDQFHFGRRVALPVRPDDHVRRRLSAILPVADIGEVVGEQVDEGVVVVEVADRRDGEKQRFDREVEPGHRIERVVVGRRHHPRAMVGEHGHVKEAIELLAQRIGVVDGGLPARAVHLVEREQVDRGAAGEVAEHGGSLLGLRSRGAGQQRGEQRAAVEAHTALSRWRRRSATKAAASCHGFSVQNERARPEGEASTKATAPSRVSCWRP